MSTSSMMFNKL